MRSAQLKKSIVDQLRLVATLKQTLSTDSVELLRLEKSLLELLLVCSEEVEEVNGTAGGLLTDRQQAIVDYLTKNGVTESQRMFQYFSGTVSKRSFKRDMSYLINGGLVGKRQISGNLVAYELVGKNKLEI